MNIHWKQVSDLENIIDPPSAVERWPYQGESANAALRLLCNLGYTQDEREYLWAGAALLSRHDEQSADSVFVDFDEGDFSCDRPLFKRVSTIFLLMFDICARGGHVDALIEMMRHHAAEVCIRRLVGECDDEETLRLGLNLVLVFYWDSGAKPLDDSLLTEFRNISDIVLSSHQKTIEAVGNVTHGEGEQTRAVVREEHAETRRGFVEQFMRWWRRLFPGKGGISQAEAARVLGVSKSTVSRIEGGTQQPPPDWPGLADRDKFTEWADGPQGVAFKARSHRQSVRAAEHGDGAIAKAEAEAARMSGGDYYRKDCAVSLSQGDIADAYELIDAIAAEDSPERRNRLADELKEAIGP